MINTNDKVNSRNRVDFARLRKYSGGGQAVAGNRYKDGTSWQNNVFNAFSEDFYNLFSGNKGDNYYNFLIDDINNFQSRYAQLRSVNPDITRPISSDEVGLYQGDINSEYSFVNKGIDSAVTAGRYQYAGTNPNSRNGIDTKANNYTPDKLWGGQTQDRTILGYRGDWDENSDAFKAHQAKLNEFGLETYLDGNVYKLRRIQKPAETSTEESDEEGSEQGDFTPDQYYSIAPYKKQPWTDWMPNMLEVIKAKNAYYNKYKNLMAQKVSLDEAPHLDYVITNDKASQDVYANTAAKVRSQAASIAGNSADADSLKQIQLEGIDKAAQYELQGQLNKTKAYNSSVEEGADIANKNNATQTAVANSNRNKLVVDFNRKLNADSEYQLNKADTEIQNIRNNTTSFGEYLKNERVNAQKYYAKQLKLLAEQDKRNILQDYYDLQNNPMSSIAFKNSYNNAFSHFNDIYSESNLEGFDKELVDLFSSDEFNDKSDSEQQEAYLNWLEARQDSNAYQNYAKQYKKQLEDLYQSKSQELQAVDDLYDLLISKLYIYPNNQGWTIGSDPLRYTPVYKPRSSSEMKTTLKEGGILNAGNGSRMVKYLEHSRKKKQDANKHDVEMAKLHLKSELESLNRFQRDTKLLNEQIKRELESLDRESLILLRSVFK